MIIAMCEPSIEHCSASISGRGSTICYRSGVRYINRSCSSKPLRIRVYMESACICNFVLCDCGRAGFWSLINQRARAVRGSFSSTAG